MNRRKEWTRRLSQSYRGVGRESRLRSMRERAAVVRSLIVFYALAIGIAWIGWFPLVAGSRGWIGVRGDAWYAALVLPASAPAVAAAIAAWMESRRDAESSDRGPARRSLLDHFLGTRVAPAWYIAALVAPVVLVGATYVVDRWLASAPTPLAPSLPRVTGMALAQSVVLSLLANPWEEVGWRGFATPRLETLCTPRVTAFVIGLAVAMWHLPLFWWRDSPMAVYPYLPWMISCVATAYVFAWLHHGAARSLLVVTVFHVALNVVSAAVGIRSFWVYGVVTVVVASVVATALTSAREKSEAYSGR